MKKNPQLQKLLSELTNSPEYNKLALGVSGGTDSVAMFLLMLNKTRIEGKEMCVFHVDHSLRLSSPSDKNFVQELCEKHSVEFYSETAKESDKAELKTLGTEAWARKFRYESFAKMLSLSNADLLATGHNANDQAETLLMRMLAGTSWQGLRGIPEEALLKTAYGSVRVWRPLLKISRPELEDLLKSEAIPHVEDETNISDVYLRNRIRHELLPLMEEISPGASRMIMALGEDAALIQDELAVKAEKYLSANCDKESGRLKINRKTETSLRREILRSWFTEFLPDVRINRKLIERADELWMSEIRGRKITHRDFSIVTDRKFLTLQKI
ncbi:MAG: tRNA lysidine(34) synthetase TilS [Candidatus Riflebacteria bacterium]|nr:tRNA lysidine(34) synthetase TilS [Candidatus Riflebacteria bacterium]